MRESWEKWEGQVIDGKFPLRRYLGSVGGNAVFLTEHGEREPRKAAIKLIPANSSGDESRLAQWELTRKLSHPHLLRLLESGRHQSGDRPLLYVVTEFAEENLGQILPQRALTSVEAREMLQPLLEVLSYLHGDGLVHGGLKPANVMAVSDQLRVSCDRIRPAGAPNERRGEKNVYSAPESANGEASPAADIWALGATLVEALTQRPPVVKGSGEPVLPKTLPEPFQEIVCHCLVRDPARRWTAGAIAAWLRPDTSVPQKKVPVSQASVSPHEQQGKSRYKIFAAAIGIALVLIVGSRMLRHPAETPVTPTPGTAQPSQAQPASVAPTPKDDQVQNRSAVSPPPSAPGARKTSSGNLIPGEVAEQVLPTVARSAQATIQGHIKVAVRVAVDGSGNVAATKLVTAGPSKYFASKAVEAARRWKFKTAEENGHDVASAWMLHFDFSRKGTTVHPMPTTH